MSQSEAEDSCLVCRRNMTNPRQLPCKHMLCLDCVRNFIKRASRRHSLPCPDCGVPFAIAVAPGENPDQLTYVKDKYRASITEIKLNNVLKHDGKVMGMAMLGQKLFVVCKSPPKIIFGYDILAEATQAMNPVTERIPEMVWPRGMAANEFLSCLYISDWSKMFGGRLWRYRTATRDARKVDIDVQPFGVSFSPRDGRIFVSCATPINIFAKMGWIYVYQDGEIDLEFMTKIDLQEIEIPRHAIHTDSSKYLVCHGWTTKSHGVSLFKEDELSRVIKTGFYGSASGGGNGEMEMNRPLSMTLDEDGLILVVDYHNHRIQLLTEDLHMVRHLVTKEEHGIKYPRHLCVSSKMGRMYVGLQDGTVHIYNTCI